MAAGKAALLLVVVSAAIVPVMGAEAVRLAYWDAGGHVAGGTLSITFWYPPGTTDHSLSACTGSGCLHLKSEDGYVAPNAMVGRQGAIALDSGDTIVPVQMSWRVLGSQDSVFQEVPLHVRVPSGYMGAVELPSEKAPDPVEPHRAYRSMPWHEAWGTQWLDLVRMAVFLALCAAVALDLTWTSRALGALALVLSVPWTPPFAGPPPFLIPLLAVALLGVQALGRWMRETLSMPDPDGPGPRGRKTDLATGTEPPIGR
jgi:hypothetical protein